MIRNDFFLSFSSRGRRVIEILGEFTVRKFPACLTSQSIIVSVVVKNHVSRFEGNMWKEVEDYYTYIFVRVVSIIAE